MTSEEVGREIERHQRLVYYVIYRHFPYLREDEDAAQIGMIALWKAVASYESGKSQFATYAIQCIKNALRGELRSRAQLWKLGEAASLDEPLYYDSNGSAVTLVLDDPEPYSQMTEPFSWWKESGGKPAWVEYLLWESAPGTRYPLKLMYKYYEDPEIGAELARRLAWERGIVTPPGSREDQKACGASTDVVQ